MDDKFIPSVIFIFSTLMLMPVMSNACDTANHSTLEREIIELSDLNSDKAQIKLYNYRDRKCTSLNKAHSDLEVSAFLPSDETTLGIFEYYRTNGENRIEALKHTLEFNIKEQKS